MLEMLNHLHKDERGVETVEYALLLAVLVLATVGAWLVLNARVVETTGTVVEALDTSEDATPCGMMITF